MLTLLRGARSLLSVLLVVGLFVLGSPVLRLVVLPGAWLFPRHRYLLVSAFMKWMSANIIRLLTVGGARFRRMGSIPTAEPVLIVGNHQSLLEIVQVDVDADLARDYDAGKVPPSLVVKLVSEVNKLTRAHAQAVQHVLEVTRLERGEPIHIIGSIDTTPEQVAQELESLNRTLRRARAAGMMDDDLREIFGDDEAPDPDDHGMQH